MIEINENTTSYTYLHMYRHTYIYAYNTYIARVGAAGFCDALWAGRSSADTSSQRRQRAQTGLGINSSTKFKINTS